LFELTLEADTIRCFSCTHSIPIEQYHSLSISNQLVQHNITIPMIISLQILTVD